MRVGAHDATSSTIYDANGDGFTSTNLTQAAEVTTHTAVGSSSATPVEHVLAGPRAALSAKPDSRRRAMEDTRAMILLLAQAQFVTERGAETDERDRTLLGTWYCQSGTSKACTKKLAASTVCMA